MHPRVPHHCSRMKVNKDVRAGGNIALLVGLGPEVSECHEDTVALYSQTKRHHI
jgi:hypothetical protein